MFLVDSLDDTIVLLLWRTAQCKTFFTSFEFYFTSSRYNPILYSTVLLLILHIVHIYYTLNELIVVVTVTIAAAAAIVNFVVVVVVVVPIL